MQYMYNRPNSDGEISMNELTQAHIEKKNNKKMIYENLYKQCCQKIRYMNEQWHKTSCNFIVPSIQMGMPIYKMDTCIVFIMYQLKQKGFFVQFVYPNILNISWKHALIRALKQDDKEWYKITEGKLYDTKVTETNNNYVNDYQIGGGGGGGSSGIGGVSSDFSNNGLRWDYAILQNQQEIPMHIDQSTSSLYSQEMANERAQELAQAQIMQHEFMEQARMRGISGSNNDDVKVFRDTIIVEAGGEEEQKEREHDRKKRMRKANEQRYKTEQQRIADVISKKNNEAMRSITYSSKNSDRDKDGHKNKKVLKIQTQ